MAAGAVHRRAFFPRRVRVLAARIAPLLPGGRILDVGCGDGSVAARIAVLRPDVEIRGFDTLRRPHARIPVEEFDGRVLPVEDAAAQAVILVDVLHHSADAASLLRECARVAPLVIVKDHLSRGGAESRILAAMDWVGNRSLGVALPYAYFTRDSWQQAVGDAGLTERWHGEVPGLYRFPFSLVFGGSLQFIARLERVAGYTAAPPPAGGVDHRDGP